MTHNDFTKTVIHIIKNIPKGKVLTYGRIAKLAGSPRAARQVSWILHSSSRKYKLPWHRVISSNGTISIKSVDSKSIQKHLLQQEGVNFTNNLKVDLNQYLWAVTSVDFKAKDDFWTMDSYERI
jgi:methylated-DNA-protein-cysteine methyltransferase-like protein